eukprot:TRINITY_DN18544_c0_g1_i1.p1 TRINITY_DN18544_c0_g1~~TRINITY_DN18544_c0_g1_i1.p1  ORF type:complete len:129 (+),score=4.91 TRINITY_DN18544_c0_g1_i1:48-434(+)
MSSKLQSHVLAIAQTNEARCNYPQVLDALDITVSTMPNLNLYIFEMIQNSLDCGARHIRFTVGEQFVSFEHDGQAFGNGDHHVKGMSNIFQSTKSIGSIGFMGFGFKTVYKRFKRVEVSDTCVKRKFS